MNAVNGKDTKDHPILELKNINKVFTTSDGRVIHALKGITLSLQKGECIGIVGESGSGKSTLARVVSHLTDVTSGTIHFQGKKITALGGSGLKEYYQHVQMIFQDPLGTFSPRMKIGAYMIEPFLNFKIMTKQQALGYAEKLLERVGLPGEFLKRYPSMLSGGQLQRVVIARAVGLKPDLIICDECTSALDVTIQQQIVDLFRELKKETGFSSLFITHDLALAEAICDSIHVMYDGEVVEVMDGQNILDAATHSYTMELIDSVFSIEHIVWWKAKYR
ncbi:MAG: dipeptide/oligopeptide/nickel ABC transporter ATP-binding protein [Desulfobacterium sp.]